MALAEKWVTSAEGLVTPEVGVLYDRIQVVEDTKFHTLTVQTGHTDGGAEQANTTEGSAAVIPPGVYEGKWVAVQLHSGKVRVYEGM